MAQTATDVQKRKQKVRRAGKNTRNELPTKRESKWQLPYIKINGIDRYLG